MAKATNKKHWELVNGTVRIWKKGKDDPSGPTLEFAAATENFRAELRKFRLVPISQPRKKAEAKKMAGHIREARDAFQTAVGIKTFPTPKQRREPTYQEMHQSWAAAGWGWSDAPDW